jgi:5-methylcytosine-specific restriction protein A
VPGRFDWTYEELVLACDLLMQNNWRSLTSEDPRTIELSGLLRSMSIYPVTDRPSNFRSVHSVRQKTRNIETVRPGHVGAQSHGNKHDREVLEKFIAQPDVMHNEAQSLRVSLAHGEPPDLPADVGAEYESVVEGRYMLRLHVYRERSRKARRDKIAHVRESTGALACEVCTLDFGQTYGERGDGYIECHHILPMHETGERETKPSDLALLCANCHRMIHTKPPWPSPKKLRAIMDEQARNQLGR